jgi:hypothetical protein
VYQTRAFILLPILLLGCGLLTFDVDSEASTHIDGAGALGTLLDVLSFSGLDDFNVDVQSAMQDQGVEDGDVSSVRITSFTLSGSPGDLSFLEDFAVYISAPDVDEVLVASGDSVPDVDLTPYVVADESSFRVVANGSAPADDVDVTAAFNVEIVATAQGACRTLSQDTAAAE